jgi:two-component system, NtrC family, sensor kinase
MSQRDKKGGKGAKTPSRKTLKRRSAPKTARHRNAVATAKETNVARLTRERDEALHQQAATAEILKTIRASPADTQPVFEAIVQSGLKLFPDAAILIVLPDGDKLRAAAFAETNPARAKALLGRWPVPLTREYNHAVAILDRKIVDIPDARKAPAEFASGAQYFLMTGYRAITIMPLMRGPDAIGALSVVRAAPGALSRRQIGLLKTFAAQAVIAIENTRLLNELRERTNDLAESLEQQTATSKILEVISNSPTDTQPAFDTIVRSGLKLFPRAVVTISLPDRDLIKLGAIGGADEAGVEALRGRFPMPLSHEFITGTAILDRREIDLADAHKPPKELKLGAQNLLAGGYRAMTVMPMVRGEETIGALNVVRRNPGPLSEKQRELLRTFANQAVIAIENTRLFNELRESLEQQTATSEVLRIISSSPSDLKPVFHSMLENSVRICEAKFGQMFLCESDKVRAVATLDVPVALIQEDERRGAFQPSAEGGLARAIRTKKILHIDDLMSEQPSLPVVKLGGARSYIAVPMLKESEVVGVIVIYRQEVRPFTDKQVELVKNFAAQAVIAIENTRLLSELRESLEQQTATSEVLKVISSSSGKLEPVFQAMLANAIRICEAAFGSMLLVEGNVLRRVALHNAPAQFVEFNQKNPIIPLGQVHDLNLLFETKRPVHIADAAGTEDSPIVKYGGARTLVIVPMLKEGEVVGAIGIYRQEVRPFTDKQVELVTNFAAQAVIAIENARLLSELRESLQQQTATADVLKVISRSTFDLRTVLQTLVESAATLCEADRTIITRQKDGVFYRAEAHGFSHEFMDYVRSVPIVPERGSAFGRALLERRAVHIPDVKADLEYSSLEMQRLGDYRTVLAVPMLREGVATGVLSLTRTKVHPFTERQIELASTFADQAAIAIENVRLFESVEARTRELGASLENLRATQDRLVQTQKLASLGQLTAGIAHEIKNPLNFVNNFSGVSAELVAELQETLSDVSLGEKRRAEIAELMDTLRSNLDKIVQHGKRADAIVKNMLLHSREGSGEHRVVDINALVEESLNLAYHGARAEKQGFDVTLKRSFDPAAGQADVFPQDIGRVLLNLISNGFYAATKRKAAAGNSYQPTLMASTRNLGDRVEIRVRDNGTGIPSEVKEKIFNPFFTTKPAGEGTGLGLSISHDVIVKQHGGSIEVETEPGEYTEFRIILPRAAASVTASGAQS